MSATDRLAISSILCASVSKSVESESLVEASKPVWRSLPSVLYFITSSKKFNFTYSILLNWLIYEDQVVGVRRLPRVKLQVQSNEIYFKQPPFIEALPWFGHEVALGQGGWLVLFQFKADTTWEISHTSSSIDSDWSDEVYSILFNLNVYRASDYHWKWLAEHHVDLHQNIVLPRFWELALAGCELIIS